MSEVDMDAIRQRLTWVQENADQCERSPGQVSLSGYMAACIESSRDVPALIAEVGRLRAVDADRIAQAIGDPGSIVGRKLGPSWGVGNPGYAPEEETVTRWSTRAVLAVLSGGA